MSTTAPARPVIRPPMADGTLSAPRRSLSMIKDSTAYYSHQTEGIRLMAAMGSFILADEMGLGKTLQALTVAAIDFEKGWATRVLVVAPATLKWNWYNPDSTSFDEDGEIQKFTNFSAMVLNGTKGQREKQLAAFRDTGTNILIVNYEQVGPHLEALNALHFDIMICDEAHYIKNPRSKRTKACLTVKTGRTFLLTGSPLLNQVDELWPLLHRIAPREYPNYFKFKNRYCVMGGFKNKQVVGVKNRLELQTSLDRVMVRRLKSEVLDLPEKQYVPILVDFSPRQQAMYEEAVNEMRVSLDSDPNPIEIENALSRFLRLKQICGTTATLDPDHDESTKLDLATTMAQDVVGDGQHYVIFTQFRAVQACMAARLQQVGINSYVMNGDTPNQDRVPMVKAWAAGPPAPLIAMLQVAGVGMNMTKARKALFLDRLFVPKLNEQAEDRLHRIGADATQPVQIFHIMVRKSIEQRVEAILRRKDKLFNTMVNDSDWKKALYEALKEAA